MSLAISRRGILAGTGALIVSFSSVARMIAQEGTQKPPLPGSLKDSPFLDSWIRIDSSGQITIFTGKCEIGQGIKTAFLQIAAEQLDVPVASLRLVTADTSRTPNEGFTSGSQSMQNSGTAILHAAAQARTALIAEAARRLDLPADQLTTEDATVIAADGRKLGYGALVADQFLHIDARPQSRLKEPASFKAMGKPIGRVDIPAKVTGGEAYVHDFRPAGLVHARVVRPPSYAASLTSVDIGRIMRLPGVLKVVRNGNFLAVVAEHEFQAIKAMRALAASHAGTKSRPCLIILTCRRQSWRCRHRTRRSWIVAARMRISSRDWKQPTRGPIRPTDQSDRRAP